MMNLQGKKVLVFGSGKSGIGAADLLEQTGATPVIYDGNEKIDKEAVLHKIPHHSRTEVYAGELPKEVQDSLQSQTIPEEEEDNEPKPWDEYFNSLK